MKKLFILLAVYTALNSAGQNLECLWLFSKCHAGYDYTSKAGGADAGTNE